jgi:acyl carrier protein
VTSTSIGVAVMEEIALVCAVNRDEVREQALVVEYGIDSLRAMELVAALEERFEIVVDDGHVARVRTVRDVIELVADHVA